MQLTQGCFSRACGRPFFWDFTKEDLPDFYSLYIMLYYCLTVKFKQIYLRSGRAILLDDDTLKRLGRHRIEERPSGLYAQQRPLAQWVIFAAKGARCVHLDGDENNFRKENIALRAATFDEDWFCGEVKVNNTRVPIGPFKTIPELRRAAEAVRSRRGFADPEFNVPDRDVVSAEELIRLNPHLEENAIWYHATRRGLIRNGSSGSGVSRAYLWAKPHIVNPREAWNADDERVEKIIVESKSPWIKPDIVASVALAKEARLSCYVTAAILRNLGWENSAAAPMVNGERHRMWTKDWDRSLLGDPAEALRQRVKDFENKTH